MKNVAVIGAGASGLLSAILCAKSGCKVDIFEQNAKAAKKILVSGNGRCNISNTNLSSSDYFSENPSFVAYALESFGFKEFEKFCAEIGLLLLKLEDGRAYPLSNEAKSVAKIFQDYALSLGVKFHTDTKVSDIKEMMQKYESVVVATGSRAASHLSGNSDGEEFAKEYGHKIIPAYPSLVQLHLNSKVAPKMSGVKLTAEVSLLVNSKKELSTTGDILFTDYGISGFAILDISQSASYALLNYQVVDISLNLLPSFSMQKLSAHLMKMAEKNPKLTLLDTLVGLLPLKIANGILDALNLLPTLSNTEMHTKLSKKVANLILNWRFEVNKTHGFRHAEVSGGGIDTREIDENTMMSKKQPQLYFCGEVLDVVGRRGGYNFAWSWASAFLVAKSIIK